MHPLTALTWTFTLLFAVAFSAPHASRTQFGVHIARATYSTFSGNFLQARQSCKEHGECSSPNCAGGGFQSLCENGTCVCKVPEPQPVPTNVPDYCELQNEIPNKFPERFCRCVKGDKTVTAPLFRSKDVSVEEMCSYINMPTRTTAVTVPTSTWTMSAQCLICTGTDWRHRQMPEDCDTINGCIPAPTVSPFALQMADSGVVVGAAMNPDGGNELAQNLIDGLKSHCPEDEGICDTTSFAVIDVPVIKDESVESTLWELQATVDRSRYNSSSTRDKLISAAVAGMITAAKAQCVMAPYTQDAKAGETGCPDRGFMPIGDWDPPTSPEVIVNIVDGSPMPNLPMQCRYSAQVCAAPKIIHVILGTWQNPYLNDMTISFSLEAKQQGLTNPIAQWICSAGVDALQIAISNQLKVPDIPGFDPTGDVLDMLRESSCGVGK